MKKLSSNEFYTVVITSIRGKKYDVHDIVFDDLGSMIGVLLTNNTLMRLDDYEVQKVIDYIVIGSVDKNEKDKK